MWGVQSSQYSGVFAGEKGLHDAAKSLNKTNSAEKRSTSSRFQRKTREKNCPGSEEVVVNAKRIMRAEAGDLSNTKRRYAEKKVLESTRGDTTDLKGLHPVSELKRPRENGARRKDVNECSSAWSEGRGR